jgi:ankyrin repeat protein
VYCVRNHQLSIFSAYLADVSFILSAQEKDFKDFVRLLFFDEPPQFSTRPFDPTHIRVAEHVLSLPEAQPWLTSNSENKILRLEIGDLLDEERLFDSLTTAVKMSKKHYHPTVLRIARHHQSPPKTKIGILASLIKQILREQPQLYPTVSSLFPFVYDSALSRSPTWKQRVLWRCFETLLLSPRDVDTFLFVALDSIDYLGILPRILSTTAKTAIRIRIAVTIPSLDRYPQNLPPSSHIDVDVHSDAFKVAHHHDSTTALDAATHHLHLSPATKTAMSMALPSTAPLTVPEVVPGDLHHSAAGPRLLSSIPLLRDPSDHSEERTSFARALQSEGAWLSLAVLWATRAERPLSVSELNILLTLESGSGYNNYEYESALERDRASLLPQLLPGMFSIVNGTLTAGRVRAWEHEAEMVVKARLRRTVDSHFAETCLLYLLDYLQEGPVFRAIVGEIDKDSDNQVENEVDGRERSKVKAKKEAAVSLARYAALHWVTHWKIDGEESKLRESPGFKDFFAGGETVLEGWIKLLVDSSDILADSYIEEVKKVRQLLASTSLPDRQVLEYVAFVYSHPSPTSLFDRLLVLGAELAEEQFIKGLCDVASEAAQGFTTQNVARAIAAAPPSWIKFLSRLPLDGDDAVLNKADIYLRATQLFNIPVADILLTDLRTQNTLSDSDLADLLARALCIAYEYGDTDTATALEILAHATPSSMITTTAKFETALHIAVCAANTAAVLNLLNLSVPIEAYTPTGHTPLLLASQRGFTSLVGILISEFAADVNATEVNGGTSLYFAAQSGFADIVRLLIDTEGGKASVMACNDAGDTPIVVAVKNGHVEIAKMLLETHFQNPDVGFSEGTGSDRGWGTPRGGDEGMEDVDVDAANDGVQEGRGYDSDVEMEGEADEADPEAEHLEVEQSDRIVALRVTVMVEASKKGFLEIVQMLVGEVPEDGILNESKHGFVPLHCVAKSGFVDIAKLLCKQYPALLNAADNGDSLTPLHLACYYGQKAVVDELLAHGPDLSLLDISSSRSPFTAACRVGALNVIRSLLPVLQSSENENTNIRDLGLNEAARRAHREVVEYLLDHGASPNAIDKYANAALHWAAWNMDCRLMKLLLLRRSTLDVKDEDGHTPLYDATLRDVNDTVRMLVNAGADLNCETNSGRTPLDTVVYWEKPVLVRLLLDKGARMELCPYRKDDYRSLLNFALNLSSEEVVKVLLEFYARGTADESISPTTAMDVILDEKPDLIPVLLETWPATKEYLRTNSEEAIVNIHSIASKGNVETLKVVLGVIDKDAVNTTMDTNGTLLHAAICGGKDVENKVNVLLEHGIDPSIIGGRHGTTLNAAAYFHLKSVAQLILDKLPGTTIRRRFMNVVGANGTCIQAAIMGIKNSNSGKTAVELLELLRIEGGPLTHSGIYGESLLHAAARYHTWGGSEDVLTWLLKNGVDANEPDTAGRRPMHLAINTGDVDVVKLLLTKNTTLETLDHQRMNGLHCATLSKNWTMANKLVDLYRGDDANKDISSFIEARDVDDWTPLHWACRQTDLDIVNYLIEDCKASTTAKTKGGWTPWHVAVYHGITSKDYLKLLPEPPPPERNNLPTGGVTSHNAYCDICYAVS